MAKKRLSDLLREEVNKSAEETGQVSPEEAETSSAESDKESTSTDASKSAPEAETAAAPPTGEPLRLGVHPGQQGKKAAPAEPPKSAERSSEEAADPNGTAKRSTPTKADLESTIVQLKAQLEAAQQQFQQQETELSQQVDRLQADLKRQQSTIEKLQTETQHAQSLKAELEEARQVILKLSEINAKPVDAKYAGKDGSRDSKGSSPATSQGATRQETNGLAPAAPAHPAAHQYVKAGESKPINPYAPAKPAASRSGAPIMPAPSNSAEPELESKPVQFKLPEQDAGKLAPSARHQQELRRILDHPTRPGALPPMSTPASSPSSEDKKLSETDMGWVD